MFAHLAGNMRQHIPLARKIDTKHRARQHLRHRSLRNDRSFLCHRAEYIREADALNQELLSTLPQLIERKRGHVFAQFLTFPPRARLATFLRSGKPVAIK